MSKITIKCSYCNRKFERELGRYNEAIKRKWKQYCSKECQNESRYRRIEKVCANPKCNKKVSRQLNQFKKSKSRRVFCSLSCAAIINNKSKRKIRICPACGRQFSTRRKYCSRICRLNTLKLKTKTVKVSKIQIIKLIKKFHQKHNRIPVKREFKHYNAARLRFGSWNKAIKAAEFEPNPVLFAKKQKAKDGHMCDSLSEKIIDDWLFKNNFKHKINVPYPGNNHLTCDFVIRKYFIEFFGLDGQHPRYSELAQEKRKLAKKYKLNLIELKPKHLFPKNKLDNILSFLL